MKRIAKLASLLVFVAAASTACMTSFQGSPHVEGGRAGCERKCRGQGMAVSGMVYMGEYSSACVCQVPGAGGQASASGGAAAATGGAVAVEMMRRQQEQSMRRTY
jgi:hypothetical protein